MSTFRNFDGKVVIVTGSGSGIGEEIALQFAKAGALVVITDRFAERVAKVAKKCLEITANGLKPLEVVADITNEDDCKRLINTTINEFGKLDILVNNAGISQSSPIHSKNILDIYNNIMDINVRSVIYLSHLSVEHLEKTKGNIINTSSAAGFKPVKNFGIYCISKSAVNMFTKCLALELGPKGIRVNSVNPTYVKTPFLQTLGITIEESEAYYKKLGEDHPLGRVGIPDDVAKAVLHLASDESSFVTGMHYLSDGGFMIANVRD